jgi:hypothetical protein
LFEQKNAQIGTSFEERYKSGSLFIRCWRIRTQQAREAAGADQEIDAEVAELDREGRCRIASMAAMIASREMKSEAVMVEATEE